MEENSPQSDDLENRSANCSRRDALRKTAVMGTIGLGGIASFSQTVAAANYEWEEDHEMGRQHLANLWNLDAATRIGYVGWDSTTRRHTFEFVTVANTTLDGGDPVTGIRGHEINIDACANGFIPDISENETGTAPPEDYHNTTSTSLADLAGPAIELLPIVGEATAILETSKAASNLVSTNIGCGQNISNWTLDRFTGVGDYEEAVKTQCRFGVRIPDSESSGSFRLDSTSVAYSTGPGNWGVRSSFFINIDDGGDAYVSYYDGQPIDNYSF